MAYIFCLNKADWPAFTAEVKVALGEDGEQPVWLGHFDESGTWVPVCTVEGEDGSCWTAHGLSEEQVAELKAWVPDKVQVLEALPEGWTPAQPEEAPGGEG